MNQIKSNQMEPGEKELRAIFEETTVRNVKAITLYAEETQKMVTDLEKKVRNLDGLVRLYETQFETLKKQLATLQTRVYAGGS